MTMVRWIRRSVPLATVVLASCGADGRWRSGIDRSRIRDESSSSGTARSTARSQIVMRGDRVWTNDIGRSEPRRSARERSRRFRGRTAESSCRLVHGRGDVARHRAADRAQQLSHGRARRRLAQRLGQLSSRGVLGGQRLRRIRRRERTRSRTTIRDRDRDDNRWPRTTDAIVTDDTAATVGTAAARCCTGAATSTTSSRSAFRTAASSIARCSGAQPTSIRATPATCVDAARERADECRAEPGSWFGDGDAAAEFVERVHDGDSR